ncbi:hypothetical protein [Leekyejoonella antrihumi]|uniref:DUF7847 domain-containing protein n=1 Tax=Leekyejoonella antrihumi TaxID=1660198 RepID=A0A563DT53_9MICO|nr:hypothetical protein [Leekyejoonella antrihumi]TWP33430.1 hypothetical protein FGL98_21365 [Leekyejoonella antrihumi]
MTNGWTSPSGDDGRAPTPQYGQPGPPQWGPGAPPYPGGFAPPMSPKPGVIPLRPLTLSDIFEGSIATIRGNPGATIGFALILGLIVTVPVAAAMVVVAQIPTTSQGVGVGLTVLVAYGGKFIWAFGDLLLTGMLMVVLSEAVLGRRMAIGAAWARFRPRFWALIGLTLLITLAVALSILLLVLLIVLIYATLGSTAAIIVGVLAGIGWFLTLAFSFIRLSLAAPALVLERIGPIPACKRSWALSRHQFWRILGISLLAAVVVGFIGGILSAVITFGTEAIAMTATSGTAVLTTTLLVSTVAGTLISALTAPFQAHVTGLLYLDQRIRKEALDVTLIAAADPKASVSR